MGSAALLNPVAVVALIRAVGRQRKAEEVVTREDSVTILVDEAEVVVAEEIIELLFSSRSPLTLTDHEQSGF